ncbi:hypothetical protein DBR43_03250 [Pedobacter sp. KBW06]|uniref:MBL fold metallo-hydrolase n=1 Tax=Pedobacter sp. KBW06 TaxID=2153359 RepID=UPI000F592684|nr:MBL fold metallo-hydrolase [Pedobacter sp. KBW06]RQO74425.1 hypothetical protein DBR43_03250 [Pedobacter sp. KBW06]
MITIHNFPASYGDTFLVQINDQGFQEVNILIDCGKGFAGKPQETLAKLGEHNAHRIDRFIITHFDDDHIAGLSSFITQNGKSASPNIIQIEEIWMNTFRHLQFSKRNPEVLNVEETKRLETFIRNFSIQNRERREQTIGAEQALTAGKIIYENGYVWNADFSGEACMAGRSIKVTENVKIHILTPSVEKLKAIESDFVAKLKTNHNLEPTQEDIFDDAYELFVKYGETEKKTEKPISAAHPVISRETLTGIVKDFEYDPDTRPGNGSSISFVLETKEKNILFLADAHAEDVITSLENLFPERKGPLYFDAIKVAHHGSARNNPPALFDLIDSSIFIFSTNGKHPAHVHPDVETITHIISRPLPGKTERRTLYFNHEFEGKQGHLKAFDDDTLKEHYHYELDMETEIIL